MKKVLNFKWELLVGLNFTVIFVIVRNLGINDKYDLLMNIMCLIAIPLSYIGIRTARKLMKEVFR